MRAIVCGKRTCTDREMVYAKLDELHESMGLDFILESGRYLRHPVKRNRIGGTEYFAKKWAEARGYHWRTVKRDIVALFQCGPTVVIAFPPDNMAHEIIALAFAEKVPVIYVGDGK